jgi:hypothetical protein
MSDFEQKAPALMESAPVDAEVALHGWVGYNSGPCEWFWAEDRRSLEHELTDDIRPATHLVKYFLNREGNRTHENDETTYAEPHAVAPIGWVSDYGLSTLASRAHHYCLSVSKANEKEFQHPIFASAFAASSSAGPDLIERAFEIGFCWRSQLMGQTLEDSRAVGRTLHSYLFDELFIDLTGYSSSQSSRAGIVDAKKRIIKALRQVAAEQSKETSV